MALSSLRLAYLCAVLWLTTIISGTAKAKSNDCSGHVKCTLTPRDLIVHKMSQSSFGLLRSPENGGKKLYGLKLSGVSSAIFASGKIIEIQGLDLLKILDITFENNDGVTEMHNLFFKSIKNMMSMNINSNPDLDHVNFVWTLFPKITIIIIQNNPKLIRLNPTMFRLQRLQHFSANNNHLTEFHPFIDKYSCNNFDQSMELAPFLILEEYLPCTEIKWAICGRCRYLLNIATACTMNNELILMSDFSQYFCPEYRSYTLGLQLHGTNDDEDRAHHHQMHRRSVAPVEAIEMEDDKSVPDVDPDTNKKIEITFYVCLVVVVVLCIILIVVLTGCSPNARCPRLRARTPQSPQQYRQQSQQRYPSTSPDSEVSYRGQIPDNEEY